MFFLFVLGAATLIGVIYLAISRKSGKKIRIVALCALGLMVVTVIVCLLIVFGIIDTGAPKAPMLPDMELTDAPHSAGPNFIALIMFIVFLIVVFILVMVLSLREQKKNLVDKNSW